MNEVKFQQLKIKIYGKKDSEVQEILKPFEEKYKPIRKLRDSFGASYLSIMRYIILLYDPNTDLNRDFVRLQDRKAEAAKLSGLNKLNDLSFIDKIYNCTHPETLDVIQVLLTEHYHDITYREWQTLQNELDEYTSARWERVEGVKVKKGAGEDDEEGSVANKKSMETLNLKSKLRAECQQIIALIKQYDQEIFGDHVELKESAYKSRFMSPESWSRTNREAV